MRKERPISDERDVKSFGPFGTWKNDDEPKDKPVHRGEITPNPEDDLIAQIDAKKTELDQGARTVDNPEPRDIDDEVTADELIEDELRQARYGQAAEIFAQQAEERVVPVEDGLQIGGSLREAETKEQAISKAAKTMANPGRRENSQRISAELAMRKAQADAEKNK